MKGLVLTAGRGARLRPLSHAMSRHLVPVANEPALFYGLRSLRDCGITEVALVVGDSHHHQLQRAVGSGQNFGLTVTYLRQSDPLGLAHGVLVARDFLGDDDFVMLVGGNFVPGGVTNLANRFRDERPEAMVLAGKVSDPKRYGVVCVGIDGTVTDVEDRLARPASDLALIGAYAFAPTIHQAILGTRPNWHGEWAITDALRWLVQRGLTVRADILSGHWRDTSGIDGVLDCNRSVMELLKTRIDGEIDQVSTFDGPLVVEEGAVVRNSRLTGPVIIGRHAVVEDSEIGPYTAIGAHCLLRGARVEDSVVLDGAQVTSPRAIRRSLIGREAKVGTALAEGRDTNRLVLADHSEVLLAP